MRLSTVMAATVSRWLIMGCCAILGLSSMRCTGYDNVSEGQYVQEKSHLTDSMLIIMALNIHHEGFHKYSRVRVEQWFNPASPFVLYEDDVSIFHDGQELQTKMKDIRGKQIDSLEVDGICPVAFDAIIKKPQQDLFGGHITLHEKIRHPELDSLEAHFVITEKEYSFQEIDSMRRIDKYAKAIKFYENQEHIERLRYFFWIDFYSIYHKHSPVD